MVCTRSLSLFLSFLLTHAYKEPCYHQTSQCRDSSIKLLRSCPLHFPWTSPCAEWPTDLCRPCPSKSRMKPPRTALEKHTSFSTSHIWQLMLSFYARQGISSWSSSIVPHFATSNAFVGHAYIQTILGYLLDALRNGKIQEDHPIYILELGTGHGQFTFYLLTALMEIEAIWPTHLNIKYMYVHLIVLYVHILMIFC